MWPQLAANAAIAASIYLVVALAFALSYRTFRFLDLTQAAYLVVGPYVALAAWDFGWVVAIGLAIGTTALVGASAEVFVFSPLRRFGGRPLDGFLVSLGAYIAIQNLLSVGFGDDARTLGVRFSESLELISVRVTKVQVLLIAMAVLLVALLALLMRFSQLGLKLRAVANDRELSALAGIPVQRVQAGVGAASAGLAAGGGILIALDTGFAPTSGFDLIFSGIVVAILAGRRSVLSLAVAAIALAALQTGFVILAGSIWREVLTFSILIVLLLREARR